MGLFGIGKKGPASVPVSTGNLQSQAINIMATSAGAREATTIQQSIQLNNSALPAAAINSVQDQIQTNFVPSTPAPLPVTTNGGTSLFQQAQAALDDRRAIFDKIVEKEQPEFLLKSFEKSPNNARALANGILRADPNVIEKAVNRSMEKTIKSMTEPSQVLPRPSIRGRITTPSKLMPNYIQYKRPPAADTLKLPEIRFQNDAFKFVSRTGMSAYRPEIIGLVNFERVFHDKQFTPHGLMVSFNYQNKILRKTALYNTLTELLKNNETRTILQGIIQQQDRFFSEIESVLDIFHANINSINKVKNAFELSTLEDKAFIFLTLKTFFEKRMQYDTDSYSSFSDTKILMQLLFDFRSVLENYSFNLLNTTDFDRIGDTNPISIDNTYTLQNNFNFTIRSIQSTNSSTRKATLPVEFTNFVNSLPPKPEDRVKLLLHLLSKELRVSKGLSKKPVRDKIQNYYGGDPDGNPFDNVVGQVGKDIFDPVLGNNSLASLFQIQIQNGMVLPFESKTVDDGQTNYMPGSLYFVDSIFNLVNGSSFNMQPLENYAENFSMTLGNAKFIIEETFEKFEKSTLAPWPLFWKFLQTLQAGISNTGNNNPMSEQLAVVSLFKLAAKNNTLKIMLFQFYVLMSIAMTTNSDRSKIIDKLINDLGDIRSLTYVKVDPNNLPELLSGLSELSPNLEQLAEDIENQVYTILHGPSFAETLAAIKSKGKKTGQAQASTTDKTPNRVLEDPSYRILLESPGVSGGEDGPVGERLALEKGFIKRVLLSTRNTDGNSVPTLLNQLIQFHIFFDGQASIQGNDLSYIFDNNSTRFNFISMSYLLLINFEMFSSLISKFFSADFGKSNSKPGNVDVIFRRAVNQEAYDYIDRFTAETPEPYKPLATVAAAAGAAIIDRVGAGNSSRILGANPSVFRPTTTTNSTKKRPFGNAESNSDGQYSNPSFAGASSLITTFEYQQPHMTTTRTGIGGANTFTEDFFSRTGSGQGTAVTAPSSTVNLRNSIPLPNGNIPQTALQFRQTNHVFLTLTEIKSKLAEEDNYVKNVIDILDIIGNRLSVSTAESNFYFRELERSSGFSNFLRYKENIDLGHLKVSSYIWDKIKTSDTSTLSVLDTVEKRNQAFSSERNKTLALYSLLKTSLFTGNLSSSRTKLLAIGLPVGFSTKLLDRVEKNEINARSFKDAESDVVYLTVYKKSAEDQDIIFHPQRFMFDLSLFGLDLQDAQIGNNSDLISIINRAKLFDFSGKKNADKVRLEDLKKNNRYNFLSANQIQELFFNQVVSELLKTYCYYGSGLNISEEVFLENGYTPEIYGGIDNLPEETKTLLASYFGLKTGNLNATFDSVKACFLTSADTVPESVKDDIRMLVQGPVMLREDYVKKVSLERKKFEKVLFVPIDIDSFIIDVDRTRENSTGKRVLQKQSFNDRIFVEKIGRDDELLYFNRKDQANVLVFEDYFVTVQTVRKA